MKNPRTNNHSYSFEAKWGRTAAAKGFASIPNCLIFCQANLGITNGELITLDCLIARKFHTANPFPSAATIGKSTGQKVSTVRNHLRELERKGLLKRKQRKGTSSEYDFAPLINKLSNHDCINPINKRAGVYPKPATLPYPDLDTKEYEARKRTKKNGGVTPIRDILSKRVRPP